jgi:hypothetical protein
VKNVHIPYPQMNLLDLKVLPENTTYRFGDLVFKHGIRWKQDRNTIISDPKFQGTILRKYLTNIIQDPDFKLLQNITNSHGQRHNFIIPLKDELVIHLRLGDFIGDPTEYPRYMKYTNKWVEKIFAEKSILRTHSFKKVSIVTALHFGANELINKFFYTPDKHQKNIEVLESFREKAENIGIKLHLVSNEDIDKDFHYMVNAKHYIPSISRFSKLVVRCINPNSQVYNM